MKIEVDGLAAQIACETKKDALKTIVEKAFGDYPLWVKVSETQNPEVFRIETGTRSALINSDFTEVYNR